ncbi:MAG: DUF4386 domain-containing protein [Chloroflexaceae bacterium]|nr:DUF4386 domain-containing protein [Chloroflexaceae bacterium]
MHIQTAQAHTQTGLARIVGVLFLVQFALFLIPLIVLGSAINWPVSLGDPASEVLPRIAEQASAVTIGYSGYFASALLLLPIAVLVSQLFDKRYSGLILTGAILGSIASFAKLFGIARWLVAMPFLADIYLDPAATDVTREATIVVYTALNEYAGGVGELLGVALFSGLWTLAVAVLIMRTRQLPVWLGWFGLVAAAISLLLSTGLLGVQFGTALLVGRGWSGNCG